MAWHSNGGPDCSHIGYSKFNNVGGMMTHSKNYYGGDYEIESVIANLAFNFGEELGDIQPRVVKPSAKTLDDSMMSAILKCREMGLTNEEIKRSIETNLGCYGYRADTFPIDRWMEDKP